MEPGKNLDAKSHLCRTKRLALAVSLTLAGNLLFFIYQYKRALYDHLTFWELRWPLFILIFIVLFAVLWLRARRPAADKPQP